MRLVTLTFLLCGIFYCANAAAHELRPNFIQISELSQDRYQAQWRYPASIPAKALPELGLADNCEPLGERLQLRTDDAFIGRQTHQCIGGLPGQAIKLSYPVMNPSITSLFRLELVDGTTRTHIMKPGESSWQIPARDTTQAVAWQYLNLGISHIFLGWDHLLFVVCLIFIARTAKRIFFTITGFTIAHSITLALSTLQILELPVAPVEAGIALSILFLAHEIAMNNRQTWTWQHPELVSSTFGLLHGFGFAAVLRDIGLPQVELPAALLFFNIGVELGQIAFVLAIITAFIIIRQLSRDRIGLRHWVRARQPAVYCIGTLAAFWLVQRVSGFTA